MAHFTIEFQEIDYAFVTEFQEIDFGFELKFGEISVLPNAEVYDGAYEVTPKVDSQIMPTADKFLQKDMTINAIPFFNVGNTAGGSTVYIGTEV